jgi:hypothetical protein
VIASHSHIDRHQFWLTASELKKILSSAESNCNAGDTASNDSPEAKVDA